jgi:hypothetical protein
MFIRLATINRRITMFRIWVKIIKENRLIKDTVICIDDYDMTRTHKVYKALEDACYEFDLAKPIWLSKNKTDFIHHARTRFTSDNFVEHIDFDYLDFQVIEED